MGTTPEDVNRKLEAIETKLALLTDGKTGQTHKHLYCPNCGNPTQAEGKKQGLGSPLIDEDEDEEDLEDDDEL